MSMYEIAKFLKINGAVDGRKSHDESRWLSVPRNSGTYRLRYRLWQGETGSPDFFVSSDSRGRLRDGSVKVEG